MISIERLKKLFGKDRSVIEIYKSCDFKNDKMMDCLIDYCTGIQLSEEIPSNVIEEMKEQWKEDPDIYIAEGIYIFYIPKLECIRFTMISHPNIEIKIDDLDECVRFSVPDYEKLLSNATVKHAFLQWIIYQRNKAKEQLRNRLNEINILRETIKKLDENPNLTTEDKLFIEVEGN